MAVATVVAVDAIGRPAGRLAEELDPRPLDARVVLVGLRQREERLERAIEALSNSLGQEHPLTRDAQSLRAALRTA